MKSTRAALAVLFAVLMIIMLGFGIVLPLMPYYITHFGASGRALGLTMALYSLMQFLFAPLWGRISDRVGRRPVLLVGLTGFALSFLLQGFAQSLIQLILARSLAGALTSATLPTAMAYVADTTPPDRRSGGMGLLGAAMGLGMIFGPLLGGLLSGVHPPLPPTVLGLMQTTTDPSNGALINLSFPYLASSLLALLTLPLVLVLLPESLDRTLAPEPRQGRVQQLVGALRGPLAFLSILSFLMAFALANLESILGLFGKDRFSLGPAQVGLIMGGIGVLSAVQQGLLIGPLARRFGEERLIQGGLLLSVLGMAGMALIDSFTGLLLMAILFNSGNSFLRPAVSALVSRRAGGAQGAALGVTNSFQSLGRATGPLWAGFVYDFDMVLPFWSGAVIQLLGLVFSLRVWGRQEEQPAGVLADSPLSKSEQR